MLQRGDIQRVQSWVRTRAVMPVLPVQVGMTDNLVTPADSVYSGRAARRSYDDVIPWMISAVGKPFCLAWVAPGRTATMDPAENQLPFRTIDR